MASSLCTTGCLRKQTFESNSFSRWNRSQGVLTDECISARGLEAADCSLLYLFVASCKCIRSWCLVEFVCF